MTKKLVAYFSASGITCKVAEKLAKVLEADLYEIKPLVPYTKKDLNWMDKTSRSTLEMQDADSRPELADKDADVASYDEIYIGFPIWWYVAPHIINSFLEAYSFEGKKIILFATSGSSGFGDTVNALKPSVSDSVEIIEGGMLNGNPSEEKIKKWIDNLK